MFRRIALAGTVITALAAATLTTGGASAANHPLFHPSWHGTTTSDSAGQGSAGHPAAQPQNVVACLTQNPSGSGGSAISESFASPNDIYDSTAADDFTLTSSCTLSVVKAIGQYYNGSGTAQQVQVTIYSDTGGPTPGGVMAVRTVTTPNFGDSPLGTYTIPISPAISLTPGTYWISVQAQQVTPLDEWGWDTAAQTGYPASWQNPQDGFATGCTTWSNMQTCLGTAPPDLAFTLYQQVPLPPCYSQTASSYSNAVRSRIISSTLTNDIAADDFTLTGSCKARSVDIPGKYLAGAGPIGSVMVKFYSNQFSTGLNHPNTGSGVVTPTVASFTDTAGTLHITFTNTVGLGSGLHWMSVQAVMNPGTGNWGWDTIPFTTGNKAVWKSAWNGNGTCLTWHYLQTLPLCPGATQPDLAFSINQT